MTTLETLKAARNKIISPDKWIQKTFAQDSEGNPVMSVSSLACKFCAIGAVRSVVGYGEDGEVCADELREAVGVPIEVYNDEHTHAEVLAAFDAAIAKLTTQRGD